MPDSERDLERELQDLGSRLEYPPTPGLAQAARQRIEEQDEERAARRSRFWLPALSPRWAVAAMFVVVLAVPALSPAARDALSGLFVASSGGGASGAGGVAQQSSSEAGGASEDKMMSEQAGSQAASAEAENIPESAGGGQEQSAGASGSQAASATPESGGGGQPESGGPCSPEMVVGDGAERITLQEARAQAGADCPLLLPREPAEVRPDAVYEMWIPVGKGFSLVYQTRPGLPAARDTEIGMVLTQIPGDIGSTFRRTIPKKKSVEEVTVGNGRGLWAAEVHLDPVSSGRTPLGESGRPRPRVNVLFWEQDGLSLRLESKLTREEAIRIAESVR